MTKGIETTLPVVSDDFAGAGFSLKMRVKGITSMDSQWPRDGKVRVGLTDQGDEKVIVSMTKKQALSVIKVLIGEL